MVKSLLHVDFRGFSQMAAVHFSIDIDMYIDGVCWHRRTNLFLESTLESSKRVCVYLHVWHNVLRHLASERLITMHPGQRLRSILRCEIECCAEIQEALVRKECESKPPQLRGNKTATPTPCNQGKLGVPYQKSFKIDAGWSDASKKSISMSSRGKGIKDQTPRMELVQTVHESTHGNTS